MVSMANKQSEWECRNCGQRVTLFVRVTTPPSHTCKKQRNQTINLTLKGENK